VLTFLESVGRRSEAELYLRLFRKLPKESFAVIAPGGPVVRHGLGSLVEQLRFLGDLGLFAPVVLGVFNSEAAATASERLVRRLPAVGLEASLHEMGEPELAEVVRDELRAERIPIVYFRSEPNKTFGERLASLAELVRALDTRKVVMLRRRGGLLAKASSSPLELGPGHAVPTSSGRISVINLRTDKAALLSGRHLGKREAELVEAAQSLIEAVGSSSLLVSITSPLNLLKELFTVKGAGTLVKRGTAVERHAAYAELDIERLSRLFEVSFGRSLLPGFFDRLPLAIYLEPSYRGAAVLHDEVPGAYLSKFAVEPEAQGEGIGNDLWQAILRDFPRIFWRGRPDNPINPWYQSVCDGMFRLSNWNVYWRGMAPEKIPDLIARAEALPADFGDNSLEQSPAPDPTSAMVLHDRR
jgi:acetylglutamate kinase